jgi:hypothetical protein
VSTESQCRAFRLGQYVVAHGNVIISVVTNWIKRQHPLSSPVAAALALMDGRRVATDGWIASATPLAKPANSDPPRRFPRVNLSSVAE